MASAAGFLGFLPNPRSAVASCQNLDFLISLCVRSRQFAPLQVRPLDGYRLESVAASKPGLVLVYSRHIVQL